MTESMRGPKLDASRRPMWFEVLSGGKKRRISERWAIGWLNAGTAVEVEWKPSASAVAKRCAVCHCVVRSSAYAGYEDQALCYRHREGYSAE